MRGAWIVAIGFASQARGLTREQRSAFIASFLVTWLGPENRGAQLGEISAPEGRRPAAAPVANPASPRSP
jgi:hypothetical protein